MSGSATFATRQPVAEWMWMMRYWYTMTETTIRLTRRQGRAPSLDQALLDLSATGTRFGDIDVRGHPDPLRLTVTAPGLPAVELIAPTRQGGPLWRCVADATRLTVDGATASFTQRGSGLSAGRRALHIRLGEARYRWRALSPVSKDQLVNEVTGRVAVTRWRAGAAVVTLAPAATPTDAAIAVALCTGVTSDPLRLFRIFAP
jgi:hypothetical protein